MGDNMAEKIWKYVYVDAVKVSRAFDEVIGDVSFSITADGRKYFKNCPIEYHTDYGVCFIYSDVKIEELELISTDLAPAKSVINKEDMEGLL